MRDGCQDSSDRLCNIKNVLWVFNLHSAPCTLLVCHWLPSHLCHPYWSDQDMTPGSLENTPQVVIYLQYLFIYFTINFIVLLSFLAHRCFPNVQLMQPVSVVQRDAAPCSTQLCLKEYYTQFVFHVCFSMTINMV